MKIKVASSDLQQSKIRRNWKKLGIVLSSVVLVGTMSALILPAITMTATTCGYEEHTHTEECYATKLDCSLEDLNVHTHVADCYDDEGNQICGYADYVIHSHNDYCYDSDGNLICELPVVTEHKHTDECYTLSEDGEQVLTCEEEQIVVHTHNDSCYEKDDEGNTYLTCGLLETQVHVHTDSCIKPDETDIICGKEEHTHIESCYPSETLPASSVNTKMKKEVEAVGANQGTLTNAGDAIVTNVEWTAIQDGISPWDSNNNAGNDTGDSNKIVRTFDTVNYQFNVTMDHTDESSTYSEALLRFEFVIPVNSTSTAYDEIEIDTSSMAWMVQESEDAEHKPEIRVGTRTISGTSTPVMILSCYAKLEPSDGNESVVPGQYGQNLVLKVLNKKNGDTIKPTVRVDFDVNGWTTSTRKEAAADTVTVTAAPNYNIQLKSDSSMSYYDTFDFSSGNSTAIDKNWGSSVQGRLNYYGVTLQLYNTNASKGLKGIELPQGDITFDLKLTTTYETASTGTTRDVSSAYPQLVYMAESMQYIESGGTATNGRVMKGAQRYATGLAPFGNYDVITATADKSNGARENNTVYDGGTWSVSRTNSTTVRVTIKDYEIDLDKLPTRNANSSTNSYGANVGCFSAGQICLVQPFNTRGSSTYVESGSDYDIVSTYGYGDFNTDVSVINMSATSVSGQTLKDSTGTNDAQAVTTDDNANVTVQLVPAGGIMSKVSYNDPDTMKSGLGAGTADNGYDSATIGSNISLTMGLTFRSQNFEHNDMYLATNLTKFDGDAITITADPYQVDESFSGQDGHVQADAYRYLYATKSDGSNWSSLTEMRNTYEDDLVFYESRSDVPSGHKIVGILNIFIGPNDHNTSLDYYYAFVKAQVNSDTDLIGNTYPTLATVRLWTKEGIANISGNKIRWQSAANGGTAWNNYLSDIEWEFMHALTVDSSSTMDWMLIDTSVNSISARAAARVANKGYLANGNVTGATLETYRPTVYSAGGRATDHNTNRRHDGDTLLVVGHTTSITKALSQTTSSGTAKDTYNLDNSQDIVDWELQPSSTVGGNAKGTTTTITIVDQLPGYLSYIKGSAYYGGTYTQTSENGGTKGSITGGKKREPRVTPVYSNGVLQYTNLVWVFEDIEVGSAMEKIYYSTEIGADRIIGAGTLSTDDVTNTVKIYSTLDNRLASVSNGNYAEVGINVVKGSALSFGKRVYQDEVEYNGKIDYKVYYDNNASTDADVVLLDTMPYTGYNGSDFDGSYTISSFSMHTDLETGEIPDGVEVYYTTENTYRNATVESLGGNTKAKSVISGWTKVNIASDGTTSDLNGVRPTAWAIIGTLDPGKRVEIEFSIQLSGTGTKVNTYYNRITSGDSSTLVKTVTKIAEEPPETTAPTIQPTTVAPTTAPTTTPATTVAPTTTPPTTAAPTTAPPTTAAPTTAPPTTVAPTTAPPTTVAPTTAPPTTTPPTTEPTTQPVVRTRTIEGLAWDDNNRNGLQDEGETARQSGIKVTLYSLREGGDATNIDDYTVVVATTETGKSYDVSTNTETSNGQGEYKFTNVPAGTYAVVFDGTSLNSLGSRINISPLNAGTDDSMDSDAILDGTEGNITRAYIPNISLPTDAQMIMDGETDFTSSHNDLGFYSRAEEQTTNPTPATTAPPTESDPTPELPNTGGSGTTYIYIIGIGFMLIAVAVAFNKLRRCKEDS